MIRTIACLLPLVILWAAAVASAEMKKVEHPYILWTKDDLSAIRKRIRTDPWAKARWEAISDGEDTRGGRHAKDLQRLFRFAVNGDDNLAAAEEKELMRVVRSPIPRGGAQWLTILRYDLLHDRLSQEQRDAFEKMARTYIHNAVIENAVFNPDIFNDSRNYSRYDARKYTRSNWLPNIIWPRKVSANLFAAALGDEALIRKAWGAYGSWKWYFDEYLADKGFYAEEFSKMGSTPGAMLVYCEAVRNLGLDELGYGYTGRTGATMRGHIETVMDIGYPRIDIPGSDRPHYPKVTMGDLRQGGSSKSFNLPHKAFQHSIVMGYLPNGFGGTQRWAAHGAWGGVVRGDNPQWDGYSNFTPKMLTPLWFEIGHANWPDAGFDYFLAQMRAPDEKVYHPTLYFGLKPIDPATADPPPAPSAVWPQRGMVMLRDDELPSYWSSPRPAVAMRLASNYAHHVNDSFALLGLYALNRPIYLNRQVWPGYARGWSRSVESHCGVKVDQAEPDFTHETKTLHAFEKPVKFVWAASEKVYPGVKLTRGLMLTSKYLLDVTHLDGGQTEHEYAWFAHSLGVVPEAFAAGHRKAKLPAHLTPLEDVRQVPLVGGLIDVTTVQDCALEDPSEAKMPKAWYARRVGVRMRMLGGDGARAFVAKTPEPIVGYRNEDGQRKQKTVTNEAGGVTAVVWRRAPAAAFVALHEPFEDGTPPKTALARVAQSSDAVAVAVCGDGVDDRLLMSWDTAASAGSHTMAGDGEEFIFADWAFVRIGRKTVEAFGDLRRLRVRTGGERTLMLNGKQERAIFDGAYLSYPVPRE